MVVGPGPMDDALDLSAGALKERACLVSSCQEYVPVLPASRHAMIAVQLSMPPYRLFVPLLGALLCTQKGNLGLPMHNGDARGADVAAQYHR